MRIAQRFWSLGLAIWEPAGLGICPATFSEVAAVNSEASSACASQAVAGLVESTHGWITFEV